MTKAQGRKARDDRYYQANKDAINRRRRERRQRKRERDEFGAPQLKLVERVSIDQRSAAGDPLTVSDHESDHDPVLDWQSINEVATDHGWPSRDEPSNYHKAPACDARSHGQAAESPVTGLAGLDCRASEQDQASDNDSATNHRTSDQLAKACKATDDETEPATTISHEGMKRPPMENLRFQTNNVYTLPDRSKSKLLKPAAKPSGRESLLIGFHLIVTLLLAVLGTCLQFEFYKEHDVLPGYALTLAIAGALSMLALATVRFPGFRDWPRKLVYAAFYVFFVASSSYHVLSKTWDGSAEHLATRATTNVNRSPSSDRALEAMTYALEQATKNRAYKTMGILGAAVAEHIKPVTPNISAPQPAGIPHETVRWTGAVILIVLRALLEAAQAIGATALRSYFGAGKYSSRLLLS